MGRKQKLREEKKRRIKDDPPSAAVMATARAKATAKATAVATAVAKAVSTALPTGYDHIDYLISLDRQFPVSVEYAQVVANIKNIEGMEIFELCKRGVYEHHCMRA
jgi:hypothetical protein